MAVAGPARAGGNFTRRNHYVPVWYQKRFLPTGMSKLRYLDLSPDEIKRPDGSVYRRNALLHWGPKQCFYKDDLYTLQFGELATDVIEHRLFGPIDASGRAAVEFFADYALDDGAHEAFEAIVPYMDAQRLRTPRGLARLKSQMGNTHPNQVLVLMQQIRMVHATIWAEAVWEIVRADNCDTKFLLTDDPVTFYNARVFPNSPAGRYPGDAGVGDVGTRTIFPLSLNRCLILTHLELVRDPSLNPVRPRTNMRAFQQTFVNLADIQAGRHLEEDEVLRVNLILKRRATRYIAAAQEEWLFPENKLDRTLWSSLDDDWFLFPNIIKVGFGGRMVIGFEGGGAYAQDEFGRRPSHPDYENQEQHDREWKRYQQARGEWAYKRRGKSVAMSQDDIHNRAYDAISSDDLERYIKSRRG